jgi:type II secretory pathway component GspD/PulD (secretin)
MTSLHGTTVQFLDSPRTAALFLTTGIIIGLMPSAYAFEAYASSPTAGVVVTEGNVPPEVRAKMEAAKAAAQAGQPGQQPGPPPGAKPEEGKKPEGEGEKKPDAAGTVKRPDAPPKVPDPNDLKVALDAKGNVPPFNFIGQTWPDVMQWLANLSKASLDWQELPSGYLNLTTQRSYKLDEVHDLINQALNARGFTSIQTGEVLSVVKIDKLDPSMVRQVGEEDLYNLKRYDFVKVSFELPAEMEVDKAKDDVKQILSPNAKVFPLVTTKRLLIMDSVANLRTVSELFNQERMVKDGRIVPKEFVLKHARPDHVIEILKTMVGNDGPPKPQLTPEQMQQQQQMMEQMRQQGKQPPKNMAAGDAPKVYLAMNRRRNSILVNAPPEQMKIIEQTINYCDVPFGDETAVDDAERTLFKYNLVTMDPEQLKLTLEEIGELDPRTELRADTKSKILFARATANDHKKIAALKDELDGSGRTLHVFWLARNLPADAVAGTVMALMGGQEPEEDENDGYPFFYYSWRNRDDDEKPKKGFRVDADIENNRLLAWANDAEAKEVERFLAELGKGAPADDAERTVRSFDAGDPAATARLLEQLRAAWPSLGENELIIDDKRLKNPPKPAEEKKSEEKPAATTDRAAALLQTPKFRLVQLTGAPAAATVEGAKNDDASSTGEAANDTAANNSSKDDAASATPSRRPPVTVTITEDGRILVASEDTEALDKLEKFAGAVLPQTQRYKIFHIKHANVFDVYLNLKEFYEEELKGDSTAILDWWGDVRTQDKKGDSLLSKRPTLRLIWDPASDTILVANASARQLAEIESLINEYDQPAPDDATTERVTQPVKIQYSRASTIATAVKEVYRDLLSSKDKEFDQKDGKGGGSSSGGSGVTILSYSRNNSSSDGAKKSAPVKVGFQGALSLGADDVSNIVLVSAQKEVFDGVVEMIRQLDEEAAPKTTVQVHRITGNIRAENLQKALDEAVGRAWLGNRPEPTGAAAEAQPQENNDRDRDRDRDRGDRRRGRDND